VWVGQVTIEGAQYQRVLGRKRKPGAGDGLTRGMAETRLREVRVEVEEQHRASTTRANRPTASLQAVAERRFTYLVAVMGRKETTVEDYRSMLHVHLLPFFGDVDVEEITRGQVEEFMAHMIGSGKKRGTMLNVVNMMHAVLGEALRDGLVPTNVVAQAHKPPSPRADKKVRYCSPEEVDALLRAVPDDDLGAVERTLYLTAAWTGLRKGELLALRWKNVDFASGLIRVHESLSRGRVTDPKSARSNRYVPMIRVVAEALARASTRDLWTGDEDLVFAHPHSGKALSESHVTDRCKLAMARADVRSARRFHDLRHTFGTQMASQGVPLRKLQEWLGHSSITTTEIYAQFAPAPKGDIDLAEKAYEATTRRDNCRTTAEAGTAVA